MVSVREATPGEEAAWDAFVARAAGGSFLQSWSWGVFQGSAGFRVRRFVVEARPGAITAVCLLVERPLPFGQRAWYAPWGPVLDGEQGTGNGEQVEARAARGDVLQAIRGFVAGGPGWVPVYLRVEPKLPHDPASILAVRRAGFTVLGRGVQPKATLLLDLTGSEDDLLRGMHPKTRYNIRVALRHGVRVADETAGEGLAAFLALAHGVEGRGTFRFHPAGYYRAMRETLTTTPALTILVARHRGFACAVGLFLQFGATVTYAHGASSARRRHVMASHLLQWEAIRAAKRAGARAYDFFGIAPQRPESGDRRLMPHPWAGMTRFKLGFGGAPVHFLGACDAIFDLPRYRLYTMARGLRGILHR